MVDDDCCDDYRRALAVVRANRSWIDGARIDIEGLQSERDALQARLDAALEIADELEANMCASCMRLNCGSCAQGHASWKFRSALDGGR